MREHASKKGRGSKYARLFESFELVYLERYETRKEAMQREAQIKKMSHAEKEALVFKSKPSISLNYSNRKRKQVKLSS